MRQIENATIDLYPGGYPGNIGNQTSENPNLVASWEAPPGKLLIPYTMMALVLDNRAAGSSSATVSHRRIIEWGNGGIRNNVQADIYITGKDRYRVSSVVGQVASSGSIQGVYIYSEGGTVLPYTDTTTYLMGSRGISKTSFNAWVSSGGPLSAGDVQAVYVLRGFLVNALNVIS